MSASVVERDCVAERSLWAAVLEMAIRDATGERPRYSGGYSNAVRNSAIRWLMSESLEPSSFRWICVLFDFDPAVIRQRVFGRVPVGRG